MTPNKISNEFSLIFSYNQVALVFFSIFLTLTTIFSALFYSFNKELNALQKAVQLQGVQNVKQGLMIEKIVFENSTQAAKIVSLEKELNISSSIPGSSGFSSMDPNLVIKVVVGLLAFVVLCLSAGAFFDFFWKKTVFGKLINGVNSLACRGFDYAFEAKTRRIIDVPYAKHGFTLRLDITNNDTCFVSFKETGDSSFVPFQEFLVRYKDLVASSIDFEQLQSSLLKGDCSAISNVVVDTLSSSNSLVGLEAFRVASEVVVST
jgi:hypothetical protein